MQSLKKVLPLQVFAFTSRSSEAAIPMNIQTQTQALGTPAGTANFAASFGVTMGQTDVAVFNSDARLDLQIAGDALPRGGG